MQGRVTRGTNGRVPFILRCTDMLQEIGATATQDCSYPWSLATRAGELRVAVYEHWLACRFYDVARAKTELGSDRRLNPFSGKWNWHFTSPGPEVVDSLRHQLAALLPSTPVLGPHVDDAVGMDSPVSMARIQARIDANFAIQSDVPLAEAITTIAARMEDLFGDVPRAMITETVSLVYAEAAARGVLS